MLKLMSGALALALLAAWGLARAADQASDAAAASQPAVTSHTSEMIVKDVKEVPAYLYGTDTTTLRNIQETLKKIWDPLISAQGTGSGAVMIGPPIFVCHGVTADPDHEFTLDTGLPVQADTKEKGDFKVKALSAFHCASEYYTGPIKDIGPASGKLYRDLINAGHIPTDEMREVYLFWEGADSPNNVIEIQVGIGQ